MILLDTHAAGVAFGIRPDRIRQWASRGHLVAQGRDGRRKLYAAHHIQALLVNSVTDCHTS